MVTHDITRLLERWRAGEPMAADALMPIVYSELRRMAQRYMSGERPDHTLQPTALVHEAFMQLEKMDVAWNDRSHFISTAARAMRRILVDHARAHHSQKRGAAVKADLDFSSVPSPETASTVVALDEALQKLSYVDARQSEIVELHYFGGLNQREIASSLSISVATVERELRMAKAWLHHHILKR